MASDRTRGLIVKVQEVKKRDVTLQKEDYSQKVMMKLLGAIEHQSTKCVGVGPWKSNVKLCNLINPPGKSLITWDREKRFQRLAE
jgi:hypothetical protein